MCTVQVIVMCYYSTRLSNVVYDDCFARKKTCGNVRPLNRFKVLYDIGALLVGLVNQDMWPCQSAETNIGLVSVSWNKKFFSSNENKNNVEVRIAPMVFKLISKVTKLLTNKPTNKALCTGLVL